MSGRRRFGRVRKLASGRWQARYVGADGLVRPAPVTFERKADADRWLARTEEELLSGEWIDPDSSRVLVGDFASTWVEQRAGLRPRTVVLYRGLVNKYVVPQIGALSLAALTTAKIRSWRAGLIAAGVSETTTSKAYRLLHAVMETAVEDRLVRSNPCRIRGASVERPPERPTLSVLEVLALADAMPARQRMLVLLATFASLRFGELAALQRCNVELESGFVQVKFTMSELTDGSLVVGPPKTTAGRRVVAVPSTLLPDLRRHMAEFVGPEPDALVFAGPRGGPLRRSNFQKWWTPAVKAAGVEGVHFHDLRHTGNTLMAQSGATLSDLMNRMGHASTRAAVIYLHTTSQRDRVVADGLNDLIDVSRRGTRGARTENSVSAEAFENDGSPEIRGLRGGAGDGNRTRTVSLGS